jgi:glutamyl-tRNA synthetase
MMEWDKIWSDNKKIIDPICPRFVSVRKDRACKLTLLNGPE